MTSGSTANISKHAQRGSKRAASTSADSTAAKSGTVGVHCPVCGGSAQNLFNKDSYRVCRCGGCGCEFLDPQPDDQALAEIYDAEYFLGDHNEESDQQVAALKSATSALYLDRLLPKIDANRMRLLEVGCGSGDLLMQAQARSLEVYGVEYSSAAVATANRRLGAERVQKGTIENVTLPERYFDAIAACDVIEHTRDPRSFLERANTLLRPGGLIFLVTPSLDSWSRRVLGKRWMEYKVEHLFYFGRKSLERLLSDAGFENPVFSSNRKVLSLDYIHRHFDRFPVPVLTPLFRVARRRVTEGMAHRQWVVPASGIFVVARKAAA